MTRPGLVVVSPLPPAESGVADYTQRLLPHLLEDWQVTMVLSDGDPEPTDVASEVRVLRAGAWPSSHRLLGAERMLVCLGNSVFHQHAPDFCGAHGGVVLAHEVRMTALQCLRAAYSSDPHQLSRIVEERHGPELAREVRAAEDAGPLRELLPFPPVRRRLEQANALLLGDSVAGADAVCVHSRLAARLARLELIDTKIPVSVVPFGHPDPASGPRRPVDGRIATFGMIEPEKQPALLVEAFAVVRAKAPHATLRFVGPLGVGVADMLGQLVTRLGLSDAVSWTGRVEDTVYADELAQAAVAVQLRSVVNGEASAAIADCLAEGVPTVVTAIGAHAEIPANAVRHVPAGASPRELADTMTMLLGDAPARRTLTRHARRFAAGSSFARAAAALTDVLRQAPAPLL